jgi:ketosteroid isomerase-like protein
MGRDEGQMMQSAFWLAGVALLLTAPAHAAPVDDAIATVTSVLDKFNAGDIAAFASAHRDGAIIIDEFAPYAWGGSGSVTSWLDGYAKDAAARNISDGHMAYGKPIQANSDGMSAYIVLPTTYTFKMNGKPMAGPGSMTFVMAREATGWKINSWTYSGATPTPTN